ncbi:MAG: hypothetical protein KBG11_06565 [Bacteroidia bacterium]|nr:hypothetical protein [Bacteroidia bacterium]
MINQLKTIFIILLAIISSTGNLNAQYRYTRFALDARGGLSIPNTSISGTLGGYGEIGLRLNGSRYLAGRLAVGAGNLTGSQNVSSIIGNKDNVANYTKYDASYYRIYGNIILNLERVFKLRDHGRFFHRLNPSLVVGSGYMYPDIKVNRVDGQFKNYKNNVRFITNNFGLDFRYFLSNRFDLNFGAEYNLVQTYYLDGAYSDKKYDGMTNGYVGISYNIGANANRKHMEWFNLDGKEDVIFVPFKDELKDKEEEPIAKKEDKEPEVIPTDTTVTIGEEIAIVDDTLTTPNDTEEKIAVITIKSDTLTTPTEIKITTKDPVVTVEDTVVAYKIGRYSDIKGKVTPKADQPKVAANQPKAEATPRTNLNDIDGIVRPLGKYNVIVGTYAGARYAYPFRDKVRKQGMQAALFKDSDRSKMVRVCVYYGDDRKEANTQLRIYMGKFGGQAWLHIYDPK